MAHFAKISEDNVVLQVLIVDNKDTQNADGVEVESIGQAYLEAHNNWPAYLWIQTSYNTTYNQHSLGGTPLRGNYASVGHTWDEENQIFWYFKPYPSWVKDISSAHWKSPIGDIPDLTDEEKAARIYYDWNEAGQSWDKVTPVA
tara:strand:+ start:283 stop:714 length:432 start_codon:yes stop_codon:yes gene_type:complete